MRQRQRRFGEWLLELKLLLPEQLAAALAEQETREPRAYLGEILLEQGLITENMREGILAVQKLLGSSTRLSELQVNPEVLRRVTPRFARDNAVLPLLEIADWLVVAAPQTDDDAMLDELVALTGGRIYPLAYRSADIQEAAQLAYDPRRATQTGMEWIHDELPGDGPLLTVVGSGDALASGARNQTCLHLRSQDATFLIDCGPTTLMALKQLGLPLGQLAGILLTHAHGDHFGGVPFVLLDMITQKREQPLWIMGPEHVLERVQQWNALCYPGLFDALPFELRWLPIDHEPKAIPRTGIMVYPFAMEHQRALCLGYQIHLPEEKIVAYTGDTAWCDNLEMLARDTDLLICECSYFEDPPEQVKHLSYRQLLEHRDKLQTRHLLLTHLGPEMLQRVASGHIELDTTFDGMMVDLSTHSE